MNGRMVEIKACFLTSVKARKEVPGVRQFATDLSLCRCACSWSMAYIYATVLHSTVCCFFRRNEILSLCYTCCLQRLLTDTDTFPATLLVLISMIYFYFYVVIVQKQLNHIKVEKWEPERRFRQEIQLVL